MKLRHYLPNIVFCLMLCIIPAACQTFKRVPYPAAEDSALQAEPPLSPARIREVERKFVAGAEFLFFASVIGFAATFVLSRAVPGFPNGSILALSAIGAVASASGSLLARATGGYGLVLAAAAVLCGLLLIALPHLVFIGRASWTQARSATSSMTAMLRGFVGGRPRRRAK